MNHTIILINSTAFRDEFFAHFLGATTAAQYLVLFIYIAIGVLISIRLAALKRNVESERTPKGFSWKYLTIDNFVRGLSSVCIAFVIIRFGEEISGKPLTNWGALLLGVGFDQVVSFLSDLMQSWREKLKEKLKEKFPVS